MTRFLVYVYLGAIAIAAAYAKYKFDLSAKFRAEAEQAMYEDLTFQANEQIKTARWNTGQYCKGDFFQHLDLPAGLPSAETDVFFGVVMKRGDRYFLRQNRDRVELWQDLGLQGEKKLTDMFLPGSKYCQAGEK